MNRPDDTVFTLPALNRPLGVSAPSGAGERDVLRPIHERREMSGATPIGMNPRNQRTMRSADRLFGSSRLNTKDLVGLLLAHFGAAPCPAAVSNCTC